MPIQVNKLFPGSWPLQVQYFPENSSDVDGIKQWFPVFRIRQHIENQIVDSLLIAVHNTPTFSHHFQIVGIKSNGNDFRATFQALQDVLDVMR